VEKGRTRQQDFGGEDGKGGDEGREKKTQLKRNHFVYLHQKNTASRPPKGGGSGEKEKHTELSLGRKRQGEGVKRELENLLTFRVEFTGYREKKNRVYYPGKK